jgi:nucleoside-triphosphatase
MRHRRFLLTGRPGIGKTTVTRRVVERLRAAGLRVDGFITVEIRTRGRRVGFQVEGISGHSVVMARTDWPGSPRVGRYGVDVPAFERIALPALDRAQSEGDVAVIDELGRMELLSDAFVSRLKDLLASDLPLVATVHRAAHPVTDALKARDDMELITVSEANRAELAEAVAARLLKR